MSIAENVRAFWVSKLGSGRLGQLLEGSGGTNLEKARTILRRDKDMFHELITEGFDGFFHQSVFVRTVDHKAIKDILSDIGIGTTLSGIEWWSRDDTNSKHIRLLAAVTQRMEFLTEENQVVNHNIAVPAMVELLGTTLRVRVLTVQSTAAMWGQLIGVPIRRLLTSISETDIADQLIISATDPEHLGEMQNLSPKAIELMKSTDHVYTYSGTLNVEKAGNTRHMTEGAQLRGKRRQPLHKVMRAKFNELLGADQIRQCEIEIYEKIHGLTAGTALALYPIEGKIVFRRMLGGGAVNDFLAYLAR